MTFSIFTAKLKAPPNGLSRHTGECREIISAGHIKRASESEPSDYENCSSSDDSLGTDVGHLPMKPYIIVHAMQSSTLLKMLIHYCTLWLSSQTDG